MEKILERLPAALDDDRLLRQIEVRQNKDALRYVKGEDAKQRCHKALGLA